MEYNIKKNLKEIGCEDVDWIHLVQNRVQRSAVTNMVMNLKAGGNLLGN